MNKYDIYSAIVPYEEGGSEKERPVLILNNVAMIITALKITSQGKSSITQYRIKDWVGAGLTKESYIYIDKTIKLENKQIGKKIGELQIGDVFALESLLLSRK